MFPIVLSYIYILTIFCEGDIALRSIDMNMALLKSSPFWKTFINKNVLNIFQVQYCSRPKKGLMTV